MKDLSNRNKKTNQHLNQKTLTLKLHLFLDKKIQLTWYILRVTGGNDYHDDGNNRQQTVDCQHTPLTLVPRSAELSQPDVLSSAGSAGQVLLDYDYIGLWLFWIVTILDCDYIGLWLCWIVISLYCDFFGLWLCWIVIILDCDYIGLWLWTWNLSNVLHKQDS